ncbi:MAG: hypothetical protein IKV54_05280 [Clostridia bacterium]|nr:hypothetical protein [Clostridia bacterium]
MKKNLLLFTFFLLSSALLLTAAAGYSLFSVFMIKRLDPAPYHLVIPAAAVAAASLGVYLLFEYIALRHLRVTVLCFAAVTLLFPCILFFAAAVLSRLGGITAVTVSGGTVLSLTLMLILSVRHLIKLSIKKTNRGIKK